MKNNNNNNNNNVCELGLDHNKMCFMQISQVHTNIPITNNNIYTSTYVYIHQQQHIYIKIRIYSPTTYMHLTYIITNKCQTILTIQFMEKLHHNTTFIIIQRQTNIHTSLHNLTKPFTKELQVKRTI